MKVAKLSSEVIANPDLGIPTETADRATSVPIELPLWVGGGVRPLIYQSDRTAQRTNNFRTAFQGNLVYTERKTLL